MSFMNEFMICVGEKLFLISRDVFDCESSPTLDFFSPQEVCSQIWATLYDYPCLKTTDGIIRYVKECVRVAWGLVNQVSPVRP